MKKILLATTILVGTAGFAAAEVALSGDARMGIVNANDVTSFSSRARVSFALSGETDGGLSFSAGFRADNASGAASGTSGSVSVSGAFGTLTMGDTDSAVQAGVGQVAGVGYTGNGSHNEITYLSHGDTSVLYTYSADALTVMASLGQISGDDDYSLAAAYATDAFTVALGVEDHEDEGTHTVVGASTTVGGISVKAVYGSLSSDLLGDQTQYALSATYTADALSATVFHNSSLVGEDHANGIGVSYDLGGGAAFSAGYVQTDEAGNLFDAGVTFSF